MYYNYNDENKNEINGEEVPENENMTAMPEENHDTAETASIEVDSPKYSEPENGYRSTEQNPYCESWNDPECSAPDNIDNVYSPNYHSTAAYGYATPVQEKEKKEKKKMKSGTKFAIRAVCLILACGIVSGASAAYVTGKKLENANRTQVVLGSPSGEGGGVSNDNVTNIASPTGKVMSGDQIYELARQQAVGIQISSSGTNVFGQAPISPAVVGSGFVISSDGYIVTNYHVVENVVLYGSSRGYKLSVVMNDGNTYDAEIVGYEEENDIAVLKIDATGLNPVTIGDMSSTKVGETVYAVGNPLGELTYSMTSGIISAIDRVITTEAALSINVFQFDAAVNNGNSGGPVYNNRGEVIGIVDAKYRATGVEGLGFAIPIDDAMNIIADLIEYGYVTGKAYMGVHVRTVPSEVARYYNLVEGAFIESLDENGAAAKAGLMANDIITALGNDKIKSSDDLKAAKSAYSAGDTTTIEVFRNGETLTFEITFDEESGKNNVQSPDSGNIPQMPEGNQQSSGMITD